MQLEAVWLDVAEIEAIMLVGINGLSPCAGSLEDQMGMDLPSAVGLQVIFSRVKQVFSQVF